MVHNRTEGSRYEAYNFLRITPLDMWPDGLSQDRLDVLFHSGLVRADVSSNLGPFLASLQQKKDVSFWICQGTVPRLVEIGCEMAARLRRDTELLK